MAEGIEGLGGASFVRDAPPAADTLDDRLVALAAAGAPLRRALARIAARLAATKAWGALGFVRPADYAREGPGLSPRELLDLAHVDAVLARLPCIEAAFLSGRINWTKTRLLCRVAAPEDETRWLAGAEGMTAAALAREVRAVDRGSLEALGAGETDEEGAPDGPRELLRVHCAGRVIAKWGPLRRLGNRVCGEHLPPDVCAEWIAAEMLSALPVAADAEAPEPLGRRCRAAVGDALDPPPAPARSQPKLLPFAQPPELDELVAGLDEADAFELDRRLRQVAALVHGLTARMGPLLLRLAAGRGFCEAGFRGLDDYARERLGMSPRRARSILRLERACATSPTLASAWRGGQLTFSQAQILVPLLLADGSAPFHAAWIERAAKVSVRRLEDDVDFALESGAFDPADLPALPSPAGVQIGAPPRDFPEDMPRLSRRYLERSVWRVALPADVARLVRACLGTVQRRLEHTTGRSATAGDALEVMFDHARAVWQVQERADDPDHRIAERDGWRCTVPGCTSYRNLHAHHITFRSQGGCDAAWNLTTLCAAHHQRAVHGAGSAGTGRSRIRISGLAPRGLRFEMPLATWLAGDVRA